MYYFAYSLFFVAKIVVSNKINNNDSIKGLTDRNFENKIKAIQRADDMTLTLKK